MDNSINRFGEYWNYIIFIVNVHTSLIWVIKFWRLNENKRLWEFEMNKYFTKEYIAECDCKKIQDLRIEIKENDYISTLKDYFAILCYYPEPINNLRDNYIWIPSGDQLDEEIKNILDKKLPLHERDYYNFQYIPYNRKFRFYFDLYYPNEETGTQIYFREFFDNNPLIAKILLLKQLLGADK